MRRFGCALVLLTLAACSPQRGEGVHVEAPEERQARQEAEFRARTPVGHADVRTRLLGLGLQADEIVPSVDPETSKPGSTSTHALLGKLSRVYLLFQPRSVIPAFVNHSKLPVPHMRQFASVPLLHAI